MATVRVKVAVAVDKSGSWSAFGGSGMDDDDAQLLNVETLEPGERRYWLTADLETPAVDEVAATVESIFVSEPAA